MNLLVAAGIFDSPLVVVAILIAGALVNWLSQRRQQKLDEQNRQDEGEAPGAPNKPPGGFDMEETLRRLLGEEPRSSPAPPPLPRPGPPPIRPRTREAGDTQPQLSPVLAPRPAAFTLPISQALEVAQPVEGAARQREVVPAVASHAPVRRSRARTRPAWNWSNRNRARQAFVASLVFNPPKGLEP